MKNILLKMPSWQLAILSGILIGIAYQPIHLGILAYIGFIPIFHAWFSNSYKNNIFSGYVFGFVYNIISNYWIAMNSGATFFVVLFSLIFAVIYLSIFWAIVGAITGTIKSNNVYFMLPFLIVSMEWIRSFGQLGFAWGNLVLTQMDLLPILQFNDYTGSYIITLWIISINVILYYYNFVKRFSTNILFVLLFIASIFIGGGWLRMTMKSNEVQPFSIDIATIQPNIDPNEKWRNANRQETFDFMDSLHLYAISLNPDIILFPETALPTYLRINSRLRQQLQNRVDISDIPILIGTVDRRLDSIGNKLYFNSALYLQPNRGYEIYDKIHLVPFAEYDLFPSLLHPLGKLNINIDRGVFRGGSDYSLFKYNDVYFSNLICYESTFARYARRFVKDGAQLLMIQANDGWLGNSAGPYQHFEHARLRAIENRVPIIRSGNTGISGVILSTGEVKMKVPLGEEAVFIENIPYGLSNTFYSMYGDVFAVLSFIIFLFIGPVFSCIKF